MIDPDVKQNIISMFRAGNQTGVVLATYPEVGKSTIYRYRDIAKSIDDMAVICTGGRPLGVISDTHEPFSHPRYREFCMDTFTQYNCDRLVHIGDFVDNHAMSFHEADPDGLSAGDEWAMAQDNMAAWFQDTSGYDVTWISGNHDNIPLRKIRAAGLSKRILRENLYNLPSNWTNRETVIINDVRYSHGIGSAGVNGHRNLAQVKGMSSVMGHCHSFGAVSYLANEFQIIYGMNVGCGIDVEAYAMAYGKDFPQRPTLGCGIVYGPELAIFIPMNMRRYSRHSK